MNHAHTFLRLGAMSGSHVLIRLVTCALRSCIACVYDTSYLRLAISKLQLRSPSDLNSKFATFLPLSHLGIAPKVRLLIARCLSGLKRIHSWPSGQQRGAANSPLIAKNPRAAPLLNKKCFERSTQRTIAADLSQLLYDK